MRRSKENPIKKITSQKKARFAKVASILAGTDLNTGISKSSNKVITEGYAEEVAQIVLHVARRTAKDLEQVAQRTAADLEQISDRSFQLIMARFDTLEKQNKEQTRLLEEHKILDNNVHDIVLKHESYWNVMKWGVGPTGVGAALAAWFGFHK